MKPFQDLLPVALVLSLGCSFPPLPPLTDAADDGDSDGGPVDGLPSDVAIELSAPIEWTFDPAVTTYELVTSLLNQATQVTVTAPAAASITVNDLPAASGVSTDPVFLMPGMNTITVQVGSGDAGATYTLQIDRGGARLAQAAYAKASNTEANDEFGHSVAIDGDTLVIGAPREDSGARGVDGDQLSNAAASSGAVYVFRRDGTAWVQEAYLKASNSETGDLFGIDVAISGDLIAVGAESEDSASTAVNGNQNDNSASGAGAVYLFRRAGTSWSQEAYLKAANAGAGDRFGFQVAASGDTVAVSAIAEDSAATGVNGNANDESAANSGAVYVFVRNDVSWAQQAYVKASNTDAGDNYGWSLDLDGDDLVVGAFLEDSVSGGADNSAGSAGAAYAYRRNASAWSSVGFLKAPNREASDLFGYAVAVDGGRIAVGAPGEDSNATGVGGDSSNNNAVDSGAVYVFDWSGSAWNFVSYVKAANTGGGDAFGWAVDVESEMMAVGAFLESSAATGIDGDASSDASQGSGAAYVFRDTGPAWVQTGYVKASNTDAGDNFGWSVAVTHDGLTVCAAKEDSVATGIDGDQADNGAATAGSCYVFH